MLKRLTNTVNHTLSIRNDVVVVENILLFFRPLEWEHRRKEIMVSFNLTLQRVLSSEKLLRVLSSLQISRNPQFVRLSLSLFLSLSLSLSPSLPLSLSLILPISLFLPFFFPFSLVFSSILSSPMSLWLIFLLSQSSENPISGPKLQQPNRYRIFVTLFIPFWIVFTTMFELEVVSEKKHFE